MEKKKPGRPAATDPNELLEVLKNYRDRLFQKNGKVTPKSNEVWIEISEKIENTKTLGRKTPGALYAYVSCNKNGVKDDLSPQILQHRDYIDDSLVEPENQQISSTLEETLDLTGDLSTTKGKFSFVFQVPGVEFDKLLVPTKIKDKRAKSGYRIRVRMSKGNWTGWITEKIFNHTRRKCGYLFRYHYINSEANSGHISGACKCGSQIEIYLKRSTENVMEIKCVITEGKKIGCGKVYLRGNERKKVAEELKKKSVYVYRAEQANKLINEGESEPGILRSAPTLRKIKSELAAAMHVDRDPVIALYKLKLLKENNTIHNIGLSPFFVHYSTKHQHTLYKTIACSEPSSVAIDATGSIIRVIVRPDGSKSGPIFLYIIVARTETSQYTVSAMLSERHHTNAIRFWLEEWISKGGLPTPKEVVCDASKALLAGAVRAFTCFETINEYANALAGDIVPPCYIRIDIAHFLKKYADLLKNLRPEIKKFYLSTLGKLARSQDIEEARRLVCALLTISLSPSDGFMPNGIACECQVQKNFMEKILTSDPSDNEENEDNRPVCCPEDEEEAEANTINKWSTWALDIKTDVETDITKSKGNGVNAHWFPEFAKRFMDDLKWLPLWSCVVRGKFGYGRVPASSAHVECEFKNIKQLLLKDEILPMRTDDFVTKHLSHLSGATKIAHAEFIEKDLIASQKSTNEVSDDEFQSDIISDEVMSNENDSSGADELIDSDENNNSSWPIKKNFQRCENCSVRICGVGKRNCVDCDALIKTAKSWETPDVRATRLRVDISLRKGECSNAPEKVFHGVRSIRQIAKPLVCPACDRGDKPGGAHKCILCKNFVHALEGCSTPYGSDDEGYGQRRICIACENQENFDVILESRERENWGGLVKTPPREMKKRKKTQKIGHDEQKKLPVGCQTCDLDPGAAGETHKCVIFDYSVEPFKSCPQPQETSRIDPKKAEKSPVNKRRAPGRYLQDKYPKNSFSLKPVLSKIPILRNGDDNGLQSIRIGKQRVDFIHTCAFDSVFNVFLTASFDSEDFLQRVVKDNAKKNDFFRLVETVRSGGITASAYRLRGKILYSLFDKQSIANELECYMLDCEATVTNMCRMLLATLSSFVEITICDRGCPKETKNLTLLSIKDTSLRVANYAETIDAELQMAPSMCLTAGCTGIKTYKIAIKGEFVLFEIVADFDPISEPYREVVMPLNIIPEIMQLSFMEKEFKLRGLINWKPPSTKTRKSATLKALGHYSAFCFRNGKWTETDKGKHTQRPKKFLVSPHILMYSS